LIEYVDKTLKMSRLDLFAPSPRQNRGYRRAATGRLGASPRKSVETKR
jgi:hypothetical protein